MRLHRFECNLTNTAQFVDQVKEVLVISTSNPEVPMRKNSFFDHFSRDARNLIYDIMEFHISGDFAGLMNSCRQAKQEVEEETARATWAYLQKVKTDFERHDGQAILYFPLSIMSKESMLGVRELTVTVKGQIEMGNLLQLSRLKLDKLRIHFQGGQYNTANYRHSAAYICHNLFREYVSSMYETSDVSFLKAQELIISYNCQADDLPLPRTLGGVKNEYRAEPQHGRSPNEFWKYIQRKHGWPYCMVLESACRPGTMPTVGLCALKCEKGRKVSSSWASLLASCGSDTSFENGASFTLKDVENIPYERTDYESPVWMEKALE